MANNTFHISAGLPPIDNSSNALALTFYLSAGLVPDDTEIGGGSGWEKKIFGITPAKVHGVIPVKVIGI